MSDQTDNKETYEPPTLMEEGSVAELTLQTGQGAYADNAFPQPVQFVS
ncbi:MAG: lasso RiPP family leader peptide-containing protein [Acidimicrobiia bacterium]